MGDLEAVSGKVPSQVREELDEEAEDRGLSRSTVIREHLEAAVEQHDDAGSEGVERGRAVSPLALVGVVSLAVAPTLLATGQTGIGAVFGVGAAAYALVWLTALDTVLEERLVGARDQLREAGGVVGFFHGVSRKLIAGSSTVEEPETLVERCANGQVVTLGLLAAATTLAVPLGVAVELFGAAAVVDLIGATGALAWVVGVVSLTYLAALFSSLAAIATIAIATVQSGAHKSDEARDAGR